MGITSSSNAQYKENKYLIQLSGKQPLSENDPIWNQLFSFTLQEINKRSNQIQLKEEVEAYCKSLFDHNQLTGNFTALIKVFLSRATEIKPSAECENKLFVWQTCNALFVIGHLCKFMAENMAEVKIIEQFEAQSLVNQNKDLASGFLFGRNTGLNYVESLMCSLLDIITNVPVLDFTYQLHVESINTLLTLLSVEMFVPFSMHESRIYSLLMTGNCGKMANVFTQKLLQNYIEQRVSAADSRADIAAHASLVFRATTAIASSVLNVIGAGKAKDTSIDGSNAIVSTLGHQSTLLLLVLINHHCRNEDDKNLYQEAFYKFCHIQGRQLRTDRGKDLQPSFHINLSRLYASLCRSQHIESNTLLLYFLLHGNAEVRSYVLSITDIESLVLPLLHILYLASTKNSHHIYMSLIILLILTEDDHFNRSVHEIKLQTIPWYTERTLTDISLGDLIILVLVRVIQFNMCRVRDRYLHTNCLAALANMSSFFRSLNYYTTQRILNLITLLAKKHKRIVEVSDSSDSSQSTTSSTQTMINMENGADLHTLEEVIRMLLEIINSCLTVGSLRYNINLVYALLHKKKSFEELQKYARFQDLLQNIETVISFFSARIDNLQPEPMTVEDIHDIIRNVCVQLPSHHLHKFPDLKFRYVEEDCPEEFFVPYVWSLVFNKSGIYWNPGCVQLFTLE